MSISITNTLFRKTLQFQILGSSGKESVQTVENVVKWSWELANYTMPCTIFTLKPILRYGFISEGHMLQAHVLHITPKVLSVSFCVGAGSDNDNESSIVTQHQGPLTTDLSFPSGCSVTLNP